MKKILFMEDMEMHALERPNLNYLGQLIVTEDKEFEEQYISLLKLEFTSDLRMYLYHIKIDEPRAAAEIVHKLKYKLRILGMDKSFDLAERHKEKLELGDMELDEEFRKILKKISLFLEMR